MNENNIDDDKLYSIEFKLGKPYYEFYTQLLVEFGDETQLLRHLMKNEEMLQNKTLVLSETANKETSDYINQHLDSINKLYDEPRYNKADGSYLLKTPANVRKFSKQTTNHISNITSARFSSPLPLSKIKQTEHLTQGQNIKTQIFSFSPATKERAITTESPINFQYSPRFIRPKPYTHQPSVYPSFPLPVAVRSRGISLMQTNYSNTSLRPNLNSHIGQM